MKSNQKQLDYLSLQTVNWGNWPSFFRECHNTHRYNVEDDEDTPTVFNNKYIKQVKCKKIQELLKYFVKMNKVSLRQKVAISSRYRKIETFETNNQK